MSVQMISRLVIENDRFLENKNPIFSESPSGQLGGPNDSKSMGNRLLSYAGDIPGLNLPDRVQLVAELDHFVGDLPSDLAGAGWRLRSGGGRGSTVREIH